MEPHSLLRIYAKNRYGVVVMKTAEQFQDYANECLEWAEAAKTDAERTVLLQMAKTWAQAAIIAKQRADDLVAPQQDGSAAA
jgi:hypothetical protein